MEKNAESDYALLDINFISFQGEIFDIQHNSSPTSSFQHIYDTVNSLKK